MRPFLRRSGQVIRTQQSAVCSISTAAAAAASTTFHHRIRAPRHNVSPCLPRHYATTPPTDPKDSRDAETKKSESDQLKDGKQHPEKSNDEENKAAKSEADEAGQDSSTIKSEAAKDNEESSLKPGYLALTEKEEEILQELEARAVERLSDAKVADLRKVLNKVRANGIPPDAREVLDHFNSGKLDILSSVKLMTHAVKILSAAARDAAEEEVSSRTPKQKNIHSPGPNAKDSKSKADSKPKMSFNPQRSFGSNTGGKKNSSESGFGGGFKMDASTLLTSALLTWLTWSFLSPGENSKEITWQEFRTAFLERGLVEKIVVLNHQSAKVFLHREAVAQQNPQSPAVNNNFFYYFSIGSIEAFERRMDEAQREMQIPSSERIPVAYQDELPWTATILSFGPTLLFIGAIVLLSRRAGGGGGQSGIFGMGRSRAKRFSHETEVKVKFSDVAGMDEAKQEIMEFVSFLKEPGIYQKLGAKIPRGAILTGPPGTGKTLIAKATAGESGVPFFSVSGSEFVEMFVGVGPSRVRDLFATARKNTPCIIFIDEIDAIGRARSNNKFSGGNDERESTLNQILTEMDGFNTTEQVVVMAGTNRIDILDKALLRPGRFDRHITIDKPTMDGRKQIFAVHLKNIVTKENMEQLKGRLAALTPGFSGADIANCVNEAALIAARKKAASVELVHFEQAIERVIGGLERKSLVLSPEEKRTVAYHEAGHAICGWYFKYADPLLKVSIIPRGQGALGYAQYLPSNGDTYLMNANQLMDRMAMTLGGRVSEELHFDTVTSGASDDFKKVTQMATAMVTRFGMSRKIGYLSFDDDGQQFHKPFSEETAKNIDSEVRRIVEDAYKQCRDLLTEKKHEVGLIAEELLTKEVLSRDDLVRVLGPRPFEDKGEFSKYFSGGAIPSGIPGPPGTSDQNPDTGLPGGPTPAPVAFKKHD